LAGLLLTDAKLPDDLMRRFFPNLVDGVNWHRKSNATEEYNCLAWSIWTDRHYIWPDVAGNSEWDPTIPRAETIPTVVQFLEKMGFRQTNTPTLEAGVEKVAIYANANGEPQHLARQLVGSGPYQGHWTSKLAGMVDGIHSHLNVLEGPSYGNVACILGRRFTGPPTIPDLHPKTLLISTSGRKIA